MSDKEQKSTSNPWADGDVEVLFDATHVREIKDTNFVETHQSERGIRHDLSEKGEDLGEGFLIHDEPVLIQRGADGGIVKITPLSELPGVHFEGTVLTLDEKPQKLVEAEAMVAEAKESPVPLSASDRDKLRHILATRLYKHYESEASLRNRAKWNPFRDGLPELPEGAPEFLKPSAMMPLVPATPGQVYEYLLKHVAQRAKIIDKKRGYGGIADIALRIE